jgi:hypothetical protein
LSVSRARIWDGIAAGMILAVVVAHVRFALLDGRPPQDPNHSHGALPVVFELMRSASNVGELAEHTFTQTSGWYNLVLATVMHVVGKDAWVLQAFHVMWVGLLLTMVALVARQLWGPAGAALALLLIPPNAESLIVVGRFGWIHVPELALFAVVLWGLVRDPALQRRSTVLVVAVAGMAGISIRPSGMIWAATLAPLLVSGVFSCESRRRFALRCSAVLGCWALALIPLIQELNHYVGNKMVSRDTYAFLGSPAILFAAVRADVGVITGVAALVGIGVLATKLPRERWQVLALLVVWAVLPFVLSLTMHAGMPNFPTYCVALALLGAGGLRRFPRIAAPLLGVVWLTLYVGQWLPHHTAGHLFARWGPSNLYTDDPLNHYRVDRWMDADTILELIDASCPHMDRRECTIHVDRCLFRPAGVDPGWLEIWLLGLDNVRLVPVWDPNYPSNPNSGDGMGSFVCRQADADWMGRFPDTPRQRDEVVQRLGYEEIWRRQMAPGCTYTWYTPDGKVEDPERMPRTAPGAVLTPGGAMNEW